MLYVYLKQNFWTEISIHIEILPIHCVFMCVQTVNSSINVMDWKVKVVIRTNKKHKRRQMACTVEVGQRWNLTEELHFPSVLLHAHSHCASTTPLYWTDSCSPPALCQRPQERGSEGERESCSVGGVRMRHPGSEVRVACAVSLCVSEQGKLWTYTHTDMYAHT